MRPTDHGGQSARQPQMGDDDHHAEEQDDGVKVDGSYRSVEANAAGDDHESGADDRDARAIESQERHVAGGDRRIRGDEDECGDGLLVDADEVGG